MFYVGKLFEGGAITLRGIVTNASSLLLFPSVYKTGTPAQEYNQLAGLSQGNQGRDSARFGSNRNLNCFQVTLNFVRY